LTLIAFGVGILIGGVNVPTGIDDMLKYVFVCVLVLFIISTFPAFARRFLVKRRVDRRERIVRR
jgi:hypothetical protein